MKLKHKTRKPGFALAVLALILFAACASGAKPDDVDYYTCTMHPQVRRDEPGQCPICHMDLVPVYKSKAATPPASPGHEGHEGHDSAPGDGASLVLEPERQGLIGVARGKVTRKRLTREIRSFGRVAFDPELAVAQRQYMEASGLSVTVREAARQRLKLLGLSDEEITALRGKKDSLANLYLPESADALWVYAPLYPDEVALVKAGDNATIVVPTSGGSVYAGTVRGLDPVVDPATHTVRARIQVLNPDTVLRPHTYVDVTIAVDLGEKLAIPRSAYIDTGARKLSYKVGEGGRLRQVAIRTGDAVGDETVVLDGLEEGDEIVTSALFLVDAETRLRGETASAGHSHH